MGRSIDGNVPLLTCLIKHQSQDFQDSSSILQILMNRIKSMQISAEV